MSLAAFLSTYRNLLFDYVAVFRNIGALNAFLHEVQESIDGRPPHYEMKGSAIAQEAWQVMGGQGDVTTTKLQEMKR